MLAGRQLRFPHRRSLTVAVRFGVPHARTSVGLAPDSTEMWARQSVAATEHGHA